MPKKKAGLGSAPLVEALKAQGQRAYAQGKHADAIKLWERALRRAPKDISLLNQLGDASLRLEDMPQAAAYYLRVADLFQADGFFLKALVMLKKVNKAMPELIDIHARMATLYEEQGLSMEAVSQYRILAEFFQKRADELAKSGTPTGTKLAFIGPFGLMKRTEAPAHRR